MTALGRLVAVVIIAAVGILAVGRLVTMLGNPAVGLPRPPAIFGNPAKDPVSGGGSDGCVAQAAPAPKLSLTPSRGGIKTKIMVRGVGFVRNGLVKISFHATDMGEVNTDCAGQFSATLAIPDPGFYSHFGNSQFDIHTTEYDGHGTYVGNGDSKSFFLTG